jgi:hypothetical protein
MNELKKKESEKSTGKFTNTFIVFVIKIQTKRARAKKRKNNK